MTCGCPIPLEPLSTKDSCLKCHRPIRGEWVVKDRQVTGFFDQLALFPTEDFDAFRWHCESRERVGRTTFKLTYLARDNIAEAKEEAADGGNYCMFAYWKMHRTGFNEDVAAELLNAAHQFARAHAALRRAEFLAHRDDIAA